MKWIEILIGWIVVGTVAVVLGALLLAVYAQAASVMLGLLASVGLVGGLCLIFAPITILMGCLFSMWERRDVLKKGWRLLWASLNVAIEAASRFIFITLGWLILLGSTAGVVIAPLTGSWGWFFFTALVAAAGWWLLWYEKRQQ